MSTLKNIAECAKVAFLSSGGGQLSGLLKTTNHISKVHDSTFLDIYGGTGHTHGSQLTLFGNDHSNGGMFSLTAYSKSNNSLYSLEGRTDGSLSWRGKGISVNSMGANYIRYDSGLQLCWGCNTGILTGNQFYVNFPVAFIGAPTCVATVRLWESDGGYYVLRLNSVSTTQAHYFMYLNSGITTNNPSVDWLAIGQWK